jgi:iron complex transport system substrate-binding protein
MKKHSSRISTKVTSIFILIALSLVFSACAPAAVEPEVQEVVEAPTEAPVVEEVVVAPIEFTDSVGKQVSIDELPESIVSLAPSITESLFAIGAGDQVVGRTEFCDYPEEALELPTIGGFSSSTISVESIIALEPDIVVGGSVNQAEVSDAMETADINAFIFEPNSVVEIIDSLSLLGEITGNPASAAELVASMQERISAIEDVVATIPEDERVTVFYEVWNDPYMTTTDQTFIGELINMAGGINIFAELEEDYPSISAEEIIEKDPQVILGPSNHSDQLTAEMIAEREGWSSLSAVAGERIYIIDGNIVSRAGPRVVDALEDIALALYPEYFGE